MSWADTWFGFSKIRTQFAVSAAYLNDYASFWFRNGSGGCPSGPRAGSCGFAVWRCGARVHITAHTDPVAAVDRSRGSRSGICNMWNPNPDCGEFFQLSEV